MLLKRWLTGAFAIAVLTVLTVLMAAGCGVQDPAKPPPKPGATTRPPGGSSVAPGSTVLAPAQGEVINKTTPFKLNTTQPVPMDFKAAYQRRAMMLVEFHKASADASNKNLGDYPQGLTVDRSVNQSVEGLRARYPGVEFFVYDIDNPGQAQKSEDLKRGQYGTLAAQLGVGYTPFVALLASQDQNYYIVNLWQGYVDAKVIDQALFELTSKAPAGNVGNKSQYDVTVDHIQLTANRAGIEYFTVTNKSDKEIDLKGWSLRLVDPATGEANPDSPGVKVNGSIKVAPGKTVSVGRVPAVVDSKGQRVAGDFQGGQNLKLTPGSQMALLDQNGAAVAMLPV